ncbi:hypothetical protein TrispH2_009274 [Trichoplax sp. H2]|nr:hypothetical protein TrispH2_009274 [Trichoplax sp. H2]|eukprot:RDD38127.1 hypothetical protein TrispH2_009274 [Trichoplax sp. H2]
MDVSKSLREKGGKYKNYNYQQALSYYKQAETLIELMPSGFRIILQGENNCDVAALYNNTWEVYSQQGKYNDSLSMLNKSYNIRLMTLTANYPDVAESYYNIGVVY